MKKMIFLVLVLALALPSAALAATSTSYVEKLYFEDYKSKVKEVKSAQNNLAKNVCPEVNVLNKEIKTLSSKLNDLKKQKASKAAQEKAKSSLDAKKKALNTAKKECAAQVQEFKVASNATLKEIATQKAALIQYIKTHLDGKDKVKENDFNTKVYLDLNEINRSFEYILEMMNAQ
ncbi:hypothetical protein [Cohnella mopanensis]|uniref:hypothetical protein n=1 Tax=Cohnella mopanensis TaxID=2911966 RepID=UPI001EF79431|nr:hypothetical protein [Cohnella mopanensis]